MLRPPCAQRELIDEPRSLEKGFVYTLSMILPDIVVGDVLEKVWVGSLLDLPKVLLLEAVRRLVMHYARTKLVVSVVVGVEIRHDIDVLSLGVRRLRFPDHGASGAVLVFAILVVVRVGTWG